MHAKATARATVASLVGAILCSNGSAALAQEPLKFAGSQLEPIVQGSRRPNSEFHVPVYRRPPDLVAVGYKPGTDAFPNKSARIGRRDEKGQLVPYYDRAAIEAGALEQIPLEFTHNPRA